MDVTHPATTISLRLRRGRRRAIAVFAGGVLALGVAAPVGAGQFDKGHFHDVGADVLKDFCGIAGFDVVHSFDVSGSFLGITHDGLVYFRDHSIGTHAFLNPDTGKSYSNKFTFSGHDKSVTDNGDGTLTLIFQGSGISSWSDGDGKVVLKVAGMFRDEVLIDHNGTPGDPSDDEFISASTIKPYRHNPFEGRDFCEDFFLFTA